MLRYILKTTFKDSYNGCEGTKLFSIDGDATLVEDALQSGGRSENGFERTELVGLEIIGTATGEAATSPEDGKIWNLHMVM